MQETQASAALLVPIVDATDGDAANADADFSDAGSCNATDANADACTDANVCTT